MPYPAFEVASGPGGSPSRRLVGLDDLEVIVAFSTNEHLGQTAEMLGCSVAKVQRTLHGIEDKLQVRLLERDGRRLRLRHAGWVLAEQAGRVLRARSDALDAVRAAASDRQVKLRIGHTFSLGISFVPRVISAYLDTDSSSVVSLRQGPATEMAISLLGGYLDAAFTSSNIVEPDIKVVPLFTEAVSLAVPESHRLQDEPVPLHDASNEPFVAMRHGSNSRALLIRACARAGFTPRIVLEADDLFTVAGVVAAGIALSVLPARMADYHTDGLRLLSLAEDTPTVRTVSLAYHSNSVHRAALARLQALAKDQAGKLTP